MQESVYYENFKYWETIFVIEVYNASSCFKNYTRFKEAKTDYKTWVEEEQKEQNRKHSKFI